MSPSAPNSTSQAKATPTFPGVEASPEVMLAAADLAMDHQLGIWDAVILSAACASGSSL